MSEAETRWIRILMTALEESVKLQSHYAELLNMHDGGERRTFPHATDWLERLLVTEIIPLSEVNGILNSLAQSAAELKP